MVKPSKTHGYTYSCTLIQVYSLVRAVIHDWPLNCHRLCIFLFTFDKWVNNCMSKKWVKHFYSDVFVFYVPFGQAQRSKE